MSLTRRVHIVPAYSLLPKAVDTVDTADMGVDTGVSRPRVWTRGGTAAEAAGAASEAAEAAAAAAAAAEEAAVSGLQVFGSVASNSGQL